MWYGHLSLFENIFKQVLLNICAPCQSMRLLRMPSVQHLSHFDWIQTELPFSLSGIVLAPISLLQNVLRESVWYMRQQASSSLPVGCASHSLCSLGTLVLLSSEEGKGVAAVADWPQVKAVAVPSASCLFLGLMHPIFLSLICPQHTHTHLVLEECWQMVCAYWAAPLHLLSFL